MKRTLRSIGALATAALALAGCGTMTVNPLVQFFDDSGTTTAIKTRLATEGGIGSLTGIGVRTRDDVVTLTGTVADDTERQRVEAIARRVAGDNPGLSQLQGAHNPAASVTTDMPPAPPPAAQQE